MKAAQTVAPRDDQHYTYALAGNPNCGKTTLFNELTGSHQYVGNWPGVTVERKAGELKSHGEQVTVVDLPGIYSLSPYTAEEMVSRNMLLDDKPDVIIDVVDATNIERNLYLTLQMAELGRPMVIALNMVDMLKSRGMVIDIQRLEHRLGIPVVAVSASKGQGIRELIDRAYHEGALKQPEMIRDYNEQSLAARIDKKYPEYSHIRHHLHERREHHGNEYLSTYVIDEIYSGDVMDALLRIEDIIEPTCMKRGFSLRWSAGKIMDNDQPTLEALELSEGETRLIDEIVSRLETETIQRDMIIADQKYRFICEVCAECVTHLKGADELTTSDRIDKIVTNRHLALPLFALVMGLVFWITFGPLGAHLTDWLDTLINDRFARWLTQGLTSIGTSPWLVSLIGDGIIAGVGSIVAFFPQILILFFFLSVLEDSGYMARAAFIMDKLLHKTGLSGRSFVPMLMGFGCTVPAVMCARTLENERDRRMTIMLTPFMSCSAKMPVYALVIAAFFPTIGGWIIIGLYALGLLLAILYAGFLNKSLLKGGHAAFVMELPPYRMPTAKTLGRHLYDRIKDFVVRAGTILLAAAVIIWFLQKFTPQLAMTDDASQSILAAIGRLIAPLLAPCGFGFWQAAVALISGLIAKEAVVGTLHILSPDGLAAMGFTPLSALSFLVFVLLYAPCVASFSAMRREFHSTRWAIGTLAAQTGIAWLAATIVYQFGSLFLRMIGG